MMAEAPVCALANSLTEVKGETLINRLVIKVKDETIVESLTGQKRRALDTKRKLADVKTEVLVDALGGTLPEVDSKSLRDTLAEVKAEPVLAALADVKVEALVHALLDMLADE